VTCVVARRSGCSAKRDASGLAPPAAASRLRAVADQQSTASMVLAESRQLRESLDRILRSQVEPATPRANDDAAMIQACYLPAIAHAALHLSADGLEWAWPDDTDDLQRPLWPLQSPPST
jgi:predicted RNA-binding Zn ribbon-like protein